jgi:hypothetical protein
MAEKEKRHEKNRGRRWKIPIYRFNGSALYFFCANYIYTGKLMGVNETCLLLTDPSIVYETGPFSEKQWKDAQPLPHDWYILINAIESFGVLK